MLHDYVPRNMEKGKYVQLREMVDCVMPDLPLKLKKVHYVVSIDWGCCGVSQVIEALWY